LSCWLKWMIIVIRGDGMKYNNGNIDNPIPDH
jgi:hypothetical protein